MTNIVKVAFGATREARTRPLYQYDYGQVLRFEGVELPQAYEVHFANHDSLGEAKPQIGDASGVTIPDEYLLNTGFVYAFLFLHTGADDGETVYKAVIPVKPKPRPTNTPITPVEQSEITQAIAALNIAVEQTARDAASAEESANDADASARNAAESERLSEEHERNAAESARSAAASEGNAEASAERARLSAVSAGESASAAATSADHAEQSASQAGWMFFEIVDGDLIMERTSTVPVDFYLENGDLIMEAVG